MKTCSAAPRSTSNNSSKPASKRLKNSRRSVDVSMTKKEIDTLLSEVKSLADEAERQIKKKALSAFTVALAHS